MGDKAKQSLPSVLLGVRPTLVMVRLADDPGWLAFGGWRLFFSALWLPVAAAGGRSQGRYTAWLHRLARRGQP